MMDALLLVFHPTVGRDVLGAPRWEAIAEVPHFNHAPAGDRCAFPQVPRIGMNARYRLKTFSRHLPFPAFAGNVLQYTPVSGSQLETSTFELWRTAKQQHTLRSVSWLCRSKVGRAGPQAERHFCGTPRFLFF